MEPFLAQIMLFGGNFAPRGWAFCDGQLLPIASYTALFSILGTTYGGDGRTTFGLPDLRGRAPIHAGNGPGLSPVRIGQKGGQENIVLNTTQLPPHSHTTTVTNGNVSIPVNSTAGDNDQTDPTKGILSNTGDDLFTGSTKNGIYGGTAVPIEGTAVNIGNTGGGQSVNVRDPFLGVNYIIALQGIFPSRS